MLDQDSAARIHEASLDLLDDPGVRLEHDAVVDVLLKAGARRGRDNQVVRLPPELVADALDRAPSSVWLADRRGVGSRLTPDGASCIWTAPGLHVLRDDVHRRARRQDLADLSRLVDRLPEVDGVVGVSMEDVRPEVSDVVGLRTMAENTSKHVRILSATPEGAAAAAEIRSVVADTPWFSMGFTAHGPLRWTHLALDIFVQSAGKGIPVTVNGEPMAGTSAPVTLAGAAAVGNAESLAGLVVNQLVEPGRPCIYNLGLAHVFDMRTAIAVTGAPENHLLADVSAAMGRFYDLPSSSWVSTESMCVDSQAALEKAMGFLSHLQSGVSLIWGVGQLESELTLSPAQAVVDDEMITYARRYLQGVEVTDETLAVDVIREVGIGGEFLSHDQTLAGFRGAFFEPTVLFRRRREAWTDAGSPPLYEIAEARAEALMAEDAEPILPDDQRAAIAEIETAFVGR